MRIKNWVAVMAGMVMIGMATAASAQHGPGAGGSQAHKPPQMQQPGAMQDPDRKQQQDMDQLRDKDMDKDMDQLHDRDRDRIQDKDIYGSAFMSAEERDQYRMKLSGAKSDQEWAKMRSEHQVEMQARAKAQGKDLDPPVYGQHMMTIEERARFTERLQAASTNAEREQIMAEHREFIRNRARELGVEEPPVRQ
ncbi:MAG: hypothetical protein OEW35_12355 [Gammaproteobacteria bacterium]|nr:hypothetical protein [Gammaproteobacteria bacterium]MDH4255175.1 hypothetical protein [Gammaproteobacteria bacterium]MDH5310058.1 hypothetical protein [Gammaproteobacteria bacterium]